MNNTDYKYDFVGEFNQGVAIVVKNNLYGVILMGGNEIIAPVYDYISPFKDGYAQAIRKGECKILDLSGRECKRYQGKLIAIPSKYDSVRDFKNGYACVKLDGKWGAIDVNCNEIYEPQFYFLSDFIGGTAKYKVADGNNANSWGFLNTEGYRSECNLKEPEIESDGNLIIERQELKINKIGSVYIDLSNYDFIERVRINNRGQLLVKNEYTLVVLPEQFFTARNFENGLARVQDSTGYWGAVDVNGRVVIPLQYIRIKSFSEDKAFAINKTGKLCLLTNKGTIIKEFDTYSDGDSFHGGYAIVSDNRKNGLIDSTGKEILSPMYGYIHHTKNSQEFKITSSSSEGRQGLFLASTGLLIEPKFNKIIEVKKDCIRVETVGIGETLLDFSGHVFIEKDGKKITFADWCIGVKALTDNIFLGISDYGYWGLLDGSGGTLCRPAFKNIGDIHNGMIPLTKPHKICIWGENRSREITQYGLYNIKSKVFIPVEYDVCPEFSNGFYKVTSKGSVGVINAEGEVVLKPEWKQIHFANGYYVVSKMVEAHSYYELEERFGLTNLNGDLILETKYDDVSVLRDGFYRVKENDEWSIFNDEGRLTKETYDEIDIDGDYFFVSKNGLSARLNEHGEKLLKSEDGTCLILPSKFAWGYDFKDGIAKVLIKNCENFVDEKFRIVISSRNQYIPVDKSIDYLVRKDPKDNYIFAIDNKYGVCNNSGEILIEAKYTDLSHFSDDLYLASIRKEDGGFAYGIIDIKGKTVLDFEYSSIKPFIGRVQHYNWLMEYEYLTDETKIPDNVEHWLVNKKGYGLIDRYGHLCIQPKYENIEKIGKCFVVEENSLYGIISSNYSIVCNPKYDTISSIGDEFLIVSICTSQAYNHKTEVFGILDSNGKERLAPIYQFIGNVNDEQVTKGRSIINLNGKLGLVDENYCILVEPQFEHISNFKNGKASVSKTICNNDRSLEKVISGEIDINGNFTDIAESTQSEIINNSQSDIIKVKTLKNGFVIIQKNDSNPIYQYCAVLDRDNNIVLPYKYHNIEEQQNGMFIVYLRTGQEDFYGLLNQDFQEVIAPKYKKIQYIQDVFAVSNGSTCGLINSNGETILPCIYYSIRPASSGLVWITKDHFELNGLASIDGKVLLEPTYGVVENFKNGYATVNNGHWYDEADFNHDLPCSYRNYSDGKWGVLNTKGQLILSTIYDSVTIEDSYFLASRTILVLSDDGFPCYKLVVGRYNTEGELMIKNTHGEYILASKKYDWQEDFNAEGQSLAYYNGFIGKINEKLQQIVSYQIEGKTFEFALLEDFDWGYDSASQFVIIEKNRKKGVIDCNNNIIIRPIYDEIDVLSDSTHFAFKCGIHNANNSSSKPSYIWSLINVEGNPVIDIKSEEFIYLGLSFIAIKTDNNKYLISDFNGILLTNILFDKVLNFGNSSSDDTEFGLETDIKEKVENYAIVCVDGKYGIIDNQGNLIIQPQYTSLSILNKNKFRANGTLINAFEQEIVLRDYSDSFLLKKYDTIQRLDNGILLVSKNDLFGCVNQLGSVIIPLKYRTLLYKNNLLFAVYYDENKNSYTRGVINFSERPIVPFSQYIEDIEIESEIIIYQQNKHWGAYTLQGKVICEPIYDHIKYVADNLIKVGKEGTGYDTYDDYYWEDGERYDYTNYSEYSMITWGLVDNNGNEILPLEYRAIADKIVDGLVEFRSNKRIGYLDITGRILLEPTYKKVEDFINGFAIVCKSSTYYDEDGSNRERTLYGVINSQFKEIIPCVYRSLVYEKETNRFKTDVGYKTLDGRFIAEVDGKELFLDKKYKYCKSFSDTCAIAVCISEGHVKYGLIDKLSNDILPPIFSRLIHIENDLYKFKINGLYGLVNSKGNIILQNVYNAIGKFEANLAGVQVNLPSLNRCEKIKVYGFVDSFGNEVLPPTYEFIGKRINNISVVMNNNTWGLFNIENHQVKIIPNAAYLGPCMDNLCKINVGGKFDKKNMKISGGLWGFVSVDGKIVIEPTYEKVCGFSEGMAAVKLNDQWGFINSEGRIIVPCEYDKVESSFYKGRGNLVKGKEVFIFDTLGKQLDSKAIYNDVDKFNYGDNDDESTYSTYGGYNGYSDSAIDEAFDGDPSLTWNCD